MQANEASCTLGISPNSLKRLCQRLGIARWPQRKLAGLVALQEHLQAEADSQLMADEQHNKVD
jgi:DNA-binding MurR/RpiR family transcriptional regulator